VGCASIIVIVIIVIKLTLESGQSQDDPKSCHSFRVNQNIKFVIVSMFITPMWQEEEPCGL